MSRREKVKEHFAQDEYEWSAKRIMVAVVCLAILVGLGFVFVSSIFKNSHINLSGKRVLGASDSAQTEIKIPNMDLALTIKTTKAIAIKFLSDRFASSGSAVGKFTHEVQEVRYGKKNVMDVFCDYWCKKK